MQTGQDQRVHLEGDGAIDNMNEQCSTATYTMKSHSSLDSLSFVGGMLEVRLLSQHKPVLTIATFSFQQLVKFF